jgi:quercetin dioxygenase-like cupin family protein
MSKDERYFAQQEGAQPSGSGSFVKWDAQQPIEILPGLRFQPILGSELMANFVSFEPNVIAPVHWHDEEQIAIVIEGEFEFEVGGEKRMVRRGEAVVIPPNVPHGARTYDSTCLEIDVFNPPRHGLLELMGLIGPDGKRITPEVP